MWIRRFTDMVSRRSALEDVRDFAAESDAISLAQRERPLAWYVTESAENTFPVLPVRTDVSVLVSIAAFDSEEHHRTVEGRHADREVASMRFSATTQLRLAPTGRSQLR